MPSSAARLAVPSETTWLIMPAMSDATEAGIACTGFLPSRSKRQTRSPAPVGASSTASGFAALSLLGEGRIGHGVFEHGDLIGTDRQRRCVGQRRRQPEAARHLDDLGTADLGRV